METIFAPIANFIIATISTFGYLGIFLTMVIESALIPLPSEIIMPFSGFLVASHKFNFWLVVLAGAAGNLIGSYVAYFIGFFGEEPIIRKIITKYGRFIFVTLDELDRAENFLRKFGQIVVFISRLVPGVRTVISLPCGVAKLPLLQFSILTFAGSALWSAFLTFVGVKLGENWEILSPVFRKFDILISVVIVAALTWYVRSKFTKKV